MSASTASAVPAFSYAQAAKGLTPANSTQTTSRNESPAASEKSNKDRPGPDSVQQAAWKSSQSRPELEEKVSTDVSPANPTSVSSNAKTSPVNHDEALDQDPQSQQNGQTARINGTSASPEPLRDIDGSESRPSLYSGRANSSEQSQTSSVRDKSAHSASDKKTKDADDDWEKVSIPSVAAEKELKAAPIPVVNIWKQRQEAQAAKLKDIVEQQRSNPPTTSISNGRPKPGNDESKRKLANKDQPHSERDLKNGDVTRTTSRRDTPGPRSSRPVSQHGDKTGSEVPLSVGDAQSWPTPETSIMDERRKSSSYERVDKPDAKLTVQKSHGKNWVSVPFVPSAKFETQLPPSAAARRGGRGSARGGRDAGVRGGYSAGAAEKPDSPGLMGPPPVPKQSGEQDRGRKSEGQRGIRGASVPTSSTRPANGDVNGLSSNKSPTSINKDDPTPEAKASPATAEDPTTEQTPKTTQSSRSSSRHAGPAGVLPNGDGPSPQGESGTNPEPNGRQSHSFEKFKGTASGAGASRGGGEFGRERPPPRNREWSRDKPDSAREKVESWRDRENPSDQTGRREPRAERGGRGNYRGRGNHSFNSTYGSYTSPLPQHGFEPSRSASQTETLTRSRQSSQPFPPSQSPGNPRSNPRSQSIPVQTMFAGYYPPGTNVSHGLPPLQTDMYGYPQMHMQPGIMSAMPYNDPLNQLALMSMVITQIEYYFSIDNLCKDVFLRKHMDGQGWVPLNVIANFKRIKTLTEDNMSIEALRYVCQTVKSIEFLPGMDGDDRLRRRDNWRDFILPPEERFESARHDGPVSAPQPLGHLGDADQGVEGGFPLTQLQSPLTAGVLPNGTPNPTSLPPYAAVSPNDAFVPPFEPSFTESVRSPTIPTLDAHVPAATMRSPPSQGPISHAPRINGHNRHSSRSDIEAHLFPDENIPNINIRMQPRTSLSGTEGGPQTNLARVASNESAGAHTDALGTAATHEQPRFPSLRGGAGNAQQLDQLRNISFGLTNGMPTTEENSVIYFTKDGHETQLPPPRPGQYDQTYLSLHEIAFQQKQMGVEGALEPLYSFWADFLVDKFNLGMYQEFKSAAISEAREGNSFGMEHLIRYYSKVLSGPVSVSERVALDMVSIAREEKGGDRPLFQTLRTAWRNGATNMKTIKRLGDHFTADEKAELDKSG